MAEAESEPRARLSLRVDGAWVTDLHYSRHLAQWRLLALRSFAMIATMYLSMWYGIRTAPPTGNCHARSSSVPGPFRDTTILL